MKVRAKWLVTDAGLVRDRTVCVEEGVIRAITEGQPSDIECAYAAPGLIDEHIHGGRGVDIMHSESGEILGWLEYLLRRGVTQALPGVYTYPVPQMRRALQTIREVMRLQREGAGGALVAGVHLEGPFVSKQALGAMDEASVLSPSVVNFHRIADGYEDMIRLVTLAPEVEGADALIGYLRGKGVAVEAGHTAATSEEATRAFSQGVRGITHFFNASTPIRHRAPGILAEALVNDGIYCECICDFVHVHPTAVKLLARCKLPDRLILVTDAVTTAGLPDGKYTHGTETVIVQGGVSRTEEGALAGGSTVLIDQVRALISIGVPPAEAFRCASANPARFLQIPGGAIAPGARAELVCLDEAFSPICTLLGKTVCGGE